MPPLRKTQKGKLKQMAELQPKVNIVGKVKWLLAGVSEVQGQAVAENLFRVYKAKLKVFLYKPGLNQL